MHVAGVADGDVRGLADEGDAGAEEESRRHAEDEEELGGGERGPLRRDRRLGHRDVRQARLAGDVQVLDARQQVVVERTRRLDIAREGEELTLHVLAGEERLALSLELVPQLGDGRLRRLVLRLHALHDLGGLLLEQLVGVVELPRELPERRVGRAELEREVLDLEPVVVLAEVLDERAVQHGGQAVVVAPLDDLVLGLEREELPLRVGEPLREVHEPLAGHVLLQVDGQHVVRGLELHELRLRLLHAGLELAELRLEEGPDLVHRLVEPLEAGLHEELRVRVGDRGGELRVGRHELHRHEARAAHRQDGELLQVLADDRGGHARAVVGIRRRGDVQEARHLHPAGEVGHLPARGFLREPLLLDHAAHQARALQERELGEVVVVLRAEGRRNVEGRLGGVRILAAQDLGSLALDQHVRGADVGRLHEHAVEDGQREEDADRLRDHRPAAAEEAEDVLDEAAFVFGRKRRVPPARRAHEVRCQGLPVVSHVSLLPVRPHAALPVAAL